MSLFIRLISCWDTPQNARNSLSELQGIQNFLGGSPQTPLDGSLLRCLTRLSQNPSYGLTGLICCPVTYTYLLNHAYNYAGSCSDTDLPTGTSPGPLRNMSPAQLYILKRGPVIDKLDGIEKWIYELVFGTLLGIIRKRRFC